MNQENLLFKGKKGISIKIVTNTIRRNLETRNSERKRRIKKSTKSGMLRTTDWEAINYGMELIEKICFEGRSLLREKIISGDKEVKVIEKNIYLYQNIILDCVGRLRRYTQKEGEMKSQIERVGGLSEILQAARDGVLVKQETRIEVIDGVRREVKYDTNYTQEEVRSCFEDYYTAQNWNTIRELETLVELGLGFGGLLATVFKKNKIDATKTAYITLSTVSIAGLKLLLQLRKTNIEEIYKLYAQRRGMINDLLVNEQINDVAEDDTIKDIEKVSKRISSMENRIDNKVFYENLFMDIISGIITGKYLSDQLEIKKDGKIDPKSLAKAVINLERTVGKAETYVQFPTQVVRIKEERDEISQNKKKIEDILKQMEEKVLPLKGVTHKFNSLEIVGFHGSFYERITDYATGEKESVEINIPELSLKGGESILLSGASGEGKSTISRLLKRGDINNRNAIKIDGNEMVDKIGGEQYMAFQRDMNLGNERNVLFQLTGKESVSDLTKTEKENLMKILNRLEFKPNTILKQLAEKKFMEFSTGQQRRLVLSNLLLQIYSGISIVFVDEPGDGVGDRLVKKQLKMIIEYAKRNNVIP